MKERPILFSGEMVRAILVGQKTQTRRIVRQALGPSTCVDCDEQGMAKISQLFGPGAGHDVEEHVSYVRSPYGVPGDRLWVRETHTQAGTGRVFYRADEGTTAPRWTPAIHMPRALSRIDLEVTAVRVERLHDITTEAIRAEGLTIPDVDYNVADDPRNLEQEQRDYARAVFRKLWDSINGKRAPWGTNPWVWVVGFQKVRP